MSSQEQRRHLLLNILVPRLEMAKKQNSDDTMLPFVFDLPESSLKMVLSEENIEELKRSLSDAILIGIDTETKPTFVPKHKLIGGPHPTSIIQIAVRSPKHLENVFIVDMLHIARHTRLLILLDNALQQGLLENQCFKLGQGLTNDLRELAEAYPAMKSFRLVSCVLETHDLMKYMKPVLVNPLSLKNIVKEFLHLNLLKTEQMSNWAKRPLTNQQLHYAACDALVLLRLYDAIYCEIGDKLNNECDQSATESDTASDTGTSTTNTITTTTTGSQVSVKDTLQTLSRTVDYIGRNFTRKAAPQRIDINRKAQYGHKQNTEIRHPECSLLNNSLMRGWQSQPAKQWLKAQISTSPEGPELDVLGKRQRRPSVSEEGDLRLPLPAGTGRHVVFTTSI